MRVLFLAAIFFCFGCARTPSESPTSQIPFDRKIWLSYTGEEKNCPRDDMANSLLNQLKVGMDKKSVIALIGKPSRVSRSDARSKKVIEVWVYPLATYEDKDDAFASELLVHLTKSGTIDKVLIDP